MKKINEYLNKNIESIVEIVIAFLLVFIPFRLVFSEFISEYVKIIPDLLIFILLILLFIKRRMKVSLYINDIFFLLFLFVGLVSTIFINNLNIINFVFQVRSISLFYILYFVVRNLKIKPSFLHVMLTSLKIVLYSLFIFAVIEKIFDKQILFPNAWISIPSASNFSRTYTLLKDPNVFGALSVFVFIINNYFIRKFNKKDSIFFNCVVICSILLSASLSATISFIISVLFLLIFSFKEKTIKFKKNITKILMILIISFLFFYFVMFLNSLYKNSDLKLIIDKSNQKIQENKEPSKPAEKPIEEPSKPTEKPIEEPNKPAEEPTEPSENNVIINNTFLKRFSAVFTLEYINGSTSAGRIYRVLKGIEILEDHFIFGTGFGTFGSSASKLIPGEPEIYAEYNIKAGFYADNEYIKVIVETGFFGAVIFVLFLITTLLKHKNEKYKILMCVVYVFLGILYNIFEIQVLSLVFWVFLGIDSEKLKSDKLIKQKSIWIDITNSPHAILFNPIINKLKDKGYNISITARDYAQTIGLLDEFKIDYLLIGDHKGKSKIKKIWGLFQRSIQLYWYAKDKDFVASLSMSSQTCMVASKMLGIPHMTLYDYEYTSGHHIDFRLSKQILTPKGVEEKTLKHYGAKMKNVIFYPGLKEQFYIYYYMNEFNKKYNGINPIKSKYEIDKDRILIVIRPEATVAHYQSNENSLCFDLVEYLSNHKSKPAIIVLPRISSQKQEYKDKKYKNVIIPDEILNGIDLVASADLVIGAGGTVNREAASIGVPAYTIYQGGLLGAVDRMLIETKRMIKIENVDDFKKIKIKKNIRKPKPIGDDFSDLYVKLVDKLVRQQ